MAKRASKSKKVKSSGGGKKSAPKAGKKSPPRKGSRVVDPFRGGDPFRVAKPV